MLAHSLYSSLQIFIDEIIEMIETIYNSSTASSSYFTFKISESSEHFLYK